MTPSIAKALEFARAAHGAQLYGDGQPYLVHLLDVVKVLEEHGIHDPTMLAAAVLHDTLEDTATTFEQLVELFGRDVADIVHAVTDEPGATRAERHAATYPKIRRVPGAIQVKLADRIANVRRSSTAPQKLAMYQAEHAEFREALAGGRQPEGVEAAMWYELNALLGR